MIFALREENKTWSSEEKELRTIRIHIDVNTICNQKCPYCYSRQEKQNWGLLMSNPYIDEELFPSISKLAEYTLSNDKFLDFVLLGGEPTLHPRFNEMLRFILSYSNTRVSITSNGTKGYNNFPASDKVRWAFTYHPSQVKDVPRWIAPILERKNDWWEVAISPLIDCWGTEEIIKTYAKNVKNVISLCNEHGLKVQPTFQFNPYLDGEVHIDMTLVERYYPFLEAEHPIYVYDEKYVNDFTILRDKLNYLKGCRCVNNNFDLSVRGELRRCCSNELVSWKDLESIDMNMICPLNECTCYGFLSLHKEI